MNWRWKINKSKCSFSSSTCSQWWDLWKLYRLWSRKLYPMIMKVLMFLTSCRARLEFKSAADVERLWSTVRFASCDLFWSFIVFNLLKKPFPSCFMLTLFRFQAKAMAGDHVVRSLLEKMAHCASSAYLEILER